eukprot:TRINITY_DN6903_c0_g1_i2.p1 TRINITY_DN6903_c0_g1~~TRINITY_DN6903_c0_g1_i2.p1  ORF type:complete len:157 (+),score=31.65 TRINITY_DN6903_c0_g1_i2:124-594(+)
MPVSQIPTVKCCDHNHWDNVRVHKLMMTLRCRVCEKQWRAPVVEVWGRLRCSAYDRGQCPKGTRCLLLHVAQKKAPLERRVRSHGVAVLKGVNQKKADRLYAKAARRSMAADHPPPSPREAEEQPAQRYYFTYDPYSWHSCHMFRDGVRPPVEVSS